MIRHKVVFTKPCEVAFCEDTVPDLQADSVMVRMHYTAISNGTELAVLTNNQNTVQTFPICLGYCGVGYVMAVGERVTKVRPGQRVMVYHGIHASVNVCPEKDVYPADNALVSDEEAAFIIIAAMGLGGVRKLRVEVGESASVVGLGNLGMFALQFLRLSGACPLIAVDPKEDRRALALRLGADAALDPTAEDFFDRVREVTGGKGIQACVEVTGQARALKQALKNAAFMGRISLLGCTRVSDCSIDYYSEVHRPGITLIGAHNFVRPQVDSYAGRWTNEDDCKAILQLIAGKRISVKEMINDVFMPQSAPAVYDRLMHDPTFPGGTMFDWRQTE